MNIKPISEDDIIVWPDGTWCYRRDLDDYGWMSDDYIVFPVDSAEWHDHVGAE